MKKTFGNMQVTRGTKNQAPEADDKQERNKVKPTKKAEYQIRLPFDIYADFKSVLCK